jgi:hypothetical protein
MNEQAAFREILPRQVTDKKTVVFVGIVQQVQRRLRASIETSL